MSAQSSFLRSVALLLLATAVGSVAARDYKVAVDRCPTEVSISVPTKFTRAIDSAAKERRDSILEKLHRNPGRTARYADVFLTNWRGERSLPSVLVGSLGSTAEIQGRVTEVQWKSLKNEALAATKGQRQEWVKKGLASLGNSSSVEAQVTELTSSRENEFTVFGQSTAAINGEQVNMHVAGKMIYVHQCLIHLTIAVDSSAHDAYEAITKYAAQTFVH